MQAEVRVLIADDQEVLRRSLRLFLSMQDGIDVVGEAADGAEAVRRVEQLDPDVVLLDITMPVIDGIAAARQIRSSFPRTKMLVLTSFIDDNRVMPALGAGVAGFLAKDVTPADLVQAIRTVHRGDPYLHADVLRQLMREVAARQEVPSGTVTILFTDVVDSTKVFERFGDQAALELLHQHDRVLRGVLQAYEGVEVKHTGDGMMAAFASARRAVSAAAEMQRTLDQSAVDLKIRVGLHTGEAIWDGTDYFGETVNLARRVADAADSGEIFVSGSTKALSEGSGARFVDRGTFLLKGFRDERRLYQLERATS